MLNGFRVHVHLLKVARRCRSATRPFWASTTRSPAESGAWKKVKTPKALSQAIRKIRGFAHPSVASFAGKPSLLANTKMSQPGHRLSAGNHRKPILPPTNIEQYPPASRPSTRLAWTMTMTKSCLSYHLLLVMRVAFSYTQSSRIVSLQCQFDQCCFSCIHAPS